MPIGFPRTARTVPSRALACPFARLPPGLLTGSVSPSVKQAHHNATPPETCYVRFANFLRL